MSRPRIVVACWRRPLPTYLGERTILDTLDLAYARRVADIGGLPLALSRPSGNLLDDVHPGELEVPATAPGGVIEAVERRVARLGVTLEHVSETGPDGERPPEHNTRHFPAASGERPDVFELVRAGGYDRDATEIWEGSAELRLYDDTLEDLQAITPREMLRGYRFSFGYTVDGVEVVAQHRQEAYA